VARFRVLRVLVPALLLPLLLALALTLKPRPPASSPSPLQRLISGPRAERIEFTDLWAEARRLLIQARHGEEHADGDYRLKGLDRVEVDRDDKPPLVLSAREGRIEGLPGYRTFLLEGGVDVHDDETGLRLLLPGVEMNERTNEARSVGSVAFSTDQFQGRSESVTYSLEGRPTVFEDFHAEDGTGSSSLDARIARMVDGLRDVVLEGDVRVRHGGGTFQSGRARIHRVENRIRQVEAEEGPSGSWPTAADGDPARFSAATLQVLWAQDGELAGFKLQGSATLTLTERSLEAERIETTRLGQNGAAAWEMSAEGDVRALSSATGDPLALTSRSLTARLDAKGTVLDGEARGNVRFEGREGSGEADLAVFTPAEPLGTILLLTRDGRRPRVSQERTRITAERILTDSRGSRLEAEGRVEATSLPSVRPGVRGAFFRGEEAVHFVARRLEAEGPGERFAFTGAARGWQGDRNLAAERIEVNQPADTLHAEGSVSSRMPRTDTPAGSEAGYVQVSADRLDYDGKAGAAVYTGNVRVRQAEGWMAAEQVEADLSATGGIEQLRAFGEVRFEFRAPSEQGLPRPVEGQGDRLVYLPAQQTIRLFGDVRPASVRMEGEGGGTTTGRVLRYRLDDGALEIESGDRDRVLIRSSGR
jgi:lipopolysaccharide transport protein LptA